MSPLTLLDVDPGMVVGIVLYAVFVVLVFLGILAAMEWWASRGSVRERQRILAEQAQAEARLQLMTQATLGQLLQAARDAQRSHVEQSAAETAPTAPWVIRQDEP